MSATADPGELITHCLCLDVGTAPHDTHALRDVGAFRPDWDAGLRLTRKTADFTGRLDQFTAGAQFVLGHNTRRFDLPTLAHLYPTLALHRLAQIDTLELSPIAFPQGSFREMYGYAQSRDCVFTISQVKSTAYVNGDAATAGVV